MIPVRISSQDLDHLIVLRLFSLEWQMTCSYHLIVVVSSPLVLLDLSAAFDTIDHNILLNILENFVAISGSALTWFKSYLSDRHQFDSNISFDHHVYSICKTVFFHLKSISKLKPMLSMSNAEMLINAFMTSRLDYYNALLGGCSAHLINKLQMVQNAAARVLTRNREVWPH